MALEASCTFFNERYLSDYAFRYALLGTKSSDWDGRLENIVDAKLLRRGWGPAQAPLKKRRIFPL